MATPVPIFERMVSMTIARSQVLFSLAVGLMLGSLNATNALAQPALVPPRTIEHGSHADGHEHNAMKAEKEISKALATLSDADRKQAEAQRFCPIMQYTRLGSDGAPHKVMIGGASVFVCCEGCIEHAKEGGKATLAMVQKQIKASATLAKLPAHERAAAESQKYCAIMNKNFLGSMGAPIRLDIGGKPVYLCCKGCVKRANADPAAALAKAEALRKAGHEDGHEGSGHKHEHEHEH
jgi:hypothetical protein